MTLSLFGSLRDVQRTVFDKALPRLVAVDEIVRSYTAQSAAVSGFLIRSDRKLLDQYEGEVILAGRAETRAKRLFAPGQERVLLDSLVEAGAEFQELVEDQVLPLALAGDRSQAFRVLGQEDRPSSIRSRGWVRR